MSTLPPSLERTAEETGAVLVMFAVFASVGTLMLAFVLDVGNWFEHQRHLQLQADAAAHAAARVVAYPCTKKIKQQIYEKAGQYGGVGSLTTPEGTFALPEGLELYNQQVGGERKGNVYEEVNIKAFHEQPFENKPAEALVKEKAPCDPEADMVDVKMTETELPWFFKAVNVPFINAHARVSIVKEKFATAVEPVIESEPIEARVFFVNDNPDGSDSNYENELLATGLLENLGSNEEKGTIKWSDASKPVAVSITKPHIGVRIALAGKTGALTGAGNEGVAVCTHQYVECFDEDSGVVPPLLNISGYTIEAKGKSEPLEPKTQKVALSTPSPDTCSDGYFSNFPGTKLTPTCTLTVTAELDYGSASTTGMTVTPEVVYTRGFTGGKLKVEGETELAKPSAGGEPWAGIVKVPSVYYDNDGSSEINLIVKCKREKGSPCEKSTKSEESVTVKDVQRTYTAGPDGSNRIIAAKVFEPGAATPVPGETGADAYGMCDATHPTCEHKLAVTVELKGSLEDAKCFYKGCVPTGGTPIPPFRMVSGDNDQENDDQFVVSCPPTTSGNGIAALYEEALAHGCKGKYAVNTQGGSCAAEKAAQEAAEKEAAAKLAREKKEKEEREKWASEEASKKITKAQREAKESEQTAARKAKEAEEEAAAAKREAAAHECVGLVSTAGAFKSEEEDTAAFQNYFSKRMESPVNGLHFYCPNKWQNNNEGGIPIIPANDSRLIQFFAVPFTVTNFERKNETSPLVPINNFATFYVTGWGNRNLEAAQGKQEWNPKERRDECSEKLFKKLPLKEREELENEAVPLPQRELKEKEKGFDDNAEQPREIVGHLIKYVNTLGEEPGTTGCEVQEIGTCEAVLTE